MKELLDKFSDEAELFISDPASLYILETDSKVPCGLLYHKDLEIKK